MKVNEQKYETEREMLEYINGKEAEFESQLAAAASGILSLGRRTVTLSGPSCSGKTTTAKKLIGALTAAGVRAHVVSIDDFYKNRENAVYKIGRDGKLKPDYETVRSIDLDAFSEFVMRLRSYDRAANAPLRVPVFDFASGRRTGERELWPEDGDIIIFEGIQAIYPEIVSLLPGEMNVSVHISVAEPLSVGGEVFMPEDIRLIRRLVRDYNYRAALPETTFYLWDDVRENEILNIEPYCAGCDFLINSLLPYELGVIKPYLFGVLGKIGDESAYAERAQKIRDTLSGVREIPLGLVPEGSVFREFLN